MCFQLQAVASKGMSCIWFLTATWRLLNKAIEINVIKAERLVRLICLLHNIIMYLEGMILLFFKKFHKFLDPSMPKQMSVVDHSVSPQKEQQI